MAFLLRKIIAICLRQLSAALAIFFYRRELRLNKNLDSVIVASKHSNAILRILLKKYSVKHKDESALKGHSFNLIELYESENKELHKIIDEVKSEQELQQTGQDVLASILNGLVRDDLLILSEVCSNFYQFTPIGYKFAIKYSSQTRYWLKYHHATVFAALACVIGAVGVIVTICTPG